MYIAVHLHAFRIYFNNKKIVQKYCKIKKSFFRSNRPFAKIQTSQRFSKNKKGTFNKVIFGNFILPQNPEKLGKNLRIKK